MNDTFPCRFCQQHNSIQMYVSECPKCHVEYMLNGNLTKIDWQTYRIYDDPIFHTVVMKLDKGLTVLWSHPNWIREPYLHCDQKHWDIPFLSPETKPEEIAKLANRLHNLIIFS